MKRIIGPRTCGRRAPLFHLPWLSRLPYLCERVRIACPRITKNAMLESRFAVAPMIDWTEIPSFPTYRIDIVEFFKKPSERVVTLS